MADLSFDDLIPKAEAPVLPTPSAGRPLSFDDLISQSMPAPNSSGALPWPPQPAPPQPAPLQPAPLQPAPLQSPQQFSPLVPQPAPTQSPATAFNALPWPQRLGTAADDIVRLMANGASFGYADKLAGLASGEGTQAERAKSQAAHDRAGVAGDVAEIGGGALPALGAYRAGITAANLVPKGITGVAGLLGRTAGAAIDGGAYGAISASGHDQDVGHGALTGAAIGAAVNPIAEGAGALVNRLLPKGPLPAPAGADALKAISGEAYKRADAAGLVVRPEGLQKLSSDIKGMLAESGYHPQLQPKIAPLLGEIDRLAQGNATLKELDTMRKMARAARTDIDDSTRKLGGAFTEKLDNYLTSMPSGDVQSVNRTEGVRALLEARKYWQMARKTETVDDAIEVATNNAGAAGTGGNIDNNIRQQFRVILNSKKRSIGWTDDEMDAMRTIARGTTMQNVTRLVGRLSPQGNGLALLLHVGAASASGGMSIPIAVGGAGAKFLADRATSSNVHSLATIIAQGGDASKVAAAKQAAERLPQTERDALTRVLTSWGVAAAAP